MKRFLLLGGIVVLFGSMVFAEGSTAVLSTSGDATRLSSKIGGMSIGYVKVGSKEVGTLAWHPDFKFGPWGLGADINIPLGQEKTSGYENVVIRYVEYDDGSRGLRYGVLENVTWGHGLLLANYSTRISGPILLNNAQMATRGYVSFDEYTVRAMSTKTGVNAIRLEEKINPMLILGQTYITDTDGVTPVGTSGVQKVSGLGADATVPLPLNFEGFAEWAQLMDHGSGLTAGISWAQDFFIANANFSAGYRLLDSRFVPGYFGEDYETNPINLASAEATGNVKNGYLAQLGMDALGIAKLNAVYENYNDSGNGSLNADLYAKLPQDMELTGYYKQPNFANFRSLSLEQGAILGGSLAYPVNPFSRVIVHYKKVYNKDTGQVEESQYYEMQLSF